MTSSPGTSEIIGRQPIHTISVGKRRDEDEENNEEANAIVRLTKGKLEKDFGGSLGSGLLIISLPVLLVVLNLKIIEENSSVFELPSLPNLNLLTDEAWVIVALWFLGHMIFSVVPIGPLVEARPLLSGKTLLYRCNGFYALVLCVSSFLCLQYHGFGVAEYVESKWLELAVVSIVLSTALSVLLYLKSLAAEPSELSSQGNTGELIYDFFIGRELNPRLGPIDLKFVTELRPGLIGWVILDLAVLISDYNRYHTVNLTLGFVVTAQTLYVADSLWFESSILSTMDIIHEGFGFMLAFGDLAWVPFTYSLQVRWIAARSLKLYFGLPVFYIGSLVVLNAVGYFIYRASNLEKDRFRGDPNHPAVKNLPSIPTAIKGRRILRGGWWGWVRHPNYLGDIFMAWSWCLACGFGSVLPYFYGVYLTGLLCNREVRDERMNKRKYGSAWIEYRRKVPFRIFRGIW